MLMAELAQCPATRPVLTRRINRPRAGGLEGRTRRGSNEHQGFKPRLTVGGRPKGGRRGMRSRHFPGTCAWVCDRRLDRGTELRMSTPQVR